MNAGQYYCVENTFSFCKKNTEKKSKGLKQFPCAAQPTLAELHPGKMKTQIQHILSPRGRAESGGSIESEGIDLVSFIQSVLIQAIFIYKGVYFASVFHYLKFSNAAISFNRDIKRVDEFAPPLSH